MKPRLKRFVGRQISRLPVMRIDRLELLDKHGRMRALLETNESYATVPALTEYHSTFPLKHYPAWGDGKGELPDLGEHVRRYLERGGHRSFLSTHQVGVPSLEEGSHISHARWSKGKVRSITTAGSFSAKRPAVVISERRAR